MVVLSDERKKKAQKRIINGLLKQIERHPDWDITSLSEICFYGMDADELSDYLRNISVMSKSFIRIGEKGDIDIHAPEFEKVVSDIVVENEWRDTVSYLKGLVDKGCAVYWFRIPKLDDCNLRRLTKGEAFRAKHGLYGHKDPKGLTEEELIQMKSMHGDRFEDYFAGRFGRIETLVGLGNIVMLGDYHDGNINVFDGVRHTVGNPCQSEKTIYMIGPCTLGGPSLVDEETIPSVIQRLINNSESGKKHKGVRVVNLGTCGNYRGYIERLSSLPLKKKDIIIVVDMLDETLCSKEFGIRINETYTIYNNCKGDIFFDKPAHINAKGANMLGEYIYDRLIADREIGARTSEEEIVQEPKLMLNPNESKDYTIWRESLKLKRYNDLSVGCIVMNANPFTNGHRYLVEQALKESELLVIFVVEEDKSKFSFEDRYEMVKRGTKDLKVVVVPSGKYVLSDATFPEYFIKSEVQDKTVSTCNDLLTFAVLVAPTFNISKRFVGEENSDAITRQYNESMMRVLADYGIDVVVIPRKRIGNAEISATNVRKFIKEKNYKPLRKIVPETTYRYLVDKGII